MNKICFFKGLFGLVLILNVQSFIWDILQDDRAKITILDFGLGPGSLNQFLVTMHLLNLDHQQTLLQLKCGILIELFQLNRSGGLASGLLPFLAFF